MPATPLDSDLMLGRLVGNYRLEEKVGTGGMGAVYRAEHILLGKRAAVKVLLPERCSNPEIVDRFFNEAKASSLIRHPGIIDIFDFGRLEDGNAYIVMELLDGETLGERLRRTGTLSANAAAAIARYVTGALAAAHGHGIIHRDLKPDNVFLVPDPTQPRGERAKLLDFGICKLQTTVSDLVKTDTGRLMGTPYYMSPEQCRGAGKIDHRTDIYSLGCVLYQMLTGRPPFVLEGAGEILAAHLYERPAPPSTHVPSVPPSLEAVVMKLLAKEPDRRFQSMEEVADALNDAVRRFAGEEPSEPSLAESHKYATKKTPRVTFSDSATTVNATTAYGEYSVQSSGRRPWWLFSLAAVGAMALGVAVAAALSPDDGDGGELAPAQVGPPPMVPAVPDPMAPPPPEPVVLPLGDPAALARVEAGSRPPATNRTFVVLTLTSEPSGALVYREADGVRLGRTPIAIEVQRGTGEAAFIVKKSGHRSERLSIPVDADREHRVSLRVRRSSMAAPGDATAGSPAAETLAPPGEPGGGASSPTPAEPPTSEEPE